jgi:hypothetical protein
MKVSSSIFINERICFVEFTMNEKIFVEILRNEMSGEVME